MMLTFQTIAGISNHDERKGRVPFFELTLLGGRLALLCWLAMTRSMIAQEAAPLSVALHVGFTRSSFRNVNASDATAAFRVFAQTMARKHGYQLEADTKLFASAGACEAEIRKGTVNLAILDAWDYLSMDIHQVMDPAFVHLEQGSVFKNYLLLTRRGSGLTELADLRGKDIMVLEGKGGNLSRAWLDWLLLAKGLGSQHAYFGNLEAVAKPTAAVLPVFFAAKPACLVDHNSFQIMAELNPQVGSNLVITGESKPYLESITCISRTGWPSERTRQDLIKTILEFHLEPTGRQILELFKVDRMVPFKEEYLDSARELQRDLAALPGGLTRNDQ